VVVAAVILHRARPIAGLGDSKQLREAVRDRLAPLIQRDALSWQIEFVTADEIDRLNIFQATMAGMRRAVCALPIAASHALVDGNKIPPGLPCPAEALVKGDTREPAIMAASILAKVARDAYMRALHGRYPQYGFDVHKGYPTPAHLARLAELGPCPEHRRSFAPVRLALVAAAD